MSLNIIGLEVHESKFMYTFIIEYVSVRLFKRLLMGDIDAFLLQIFLICLRN